MGMLVVLLKSLIKATHVSELQLSNSLVTINYRDGLIFVAYY